ncbi:hypothetical protein A2852_02885 [Candidatus Adlerbacteria bacterium RIFCSPHIGHO2_01_FULL_54_23]|uniref:Septum formation initiator n=3 Tax=Candidatus Adleribacteriota TaxID=1752736 RepID=A0A1F4XZT0_9BACT|nr:MAG: hypothetical protein UY83_C0006G0049 [Candidatus Adlerbacteria bacterium GW2011_GWA1_54_10]KKW37712.1 MAG: hypothetical protein UY86_C0004G0041 [Candidatus Adlerbacteria bacterium GW2011_GWB1_54_7]OGC79533.1 MAG: hypothetical protein A2852_02885 [Candidatus Adlerbacteria bacterium RIFCSPHIGHO2_01_FULL_54_23]OGC87179.1 MAG: hypothetical protein A3B33_01245 [Candidatus Adlerbacteria bacterium RIFCSPLOWO2_01_FULL_54_16]
MQEFRQRRANKASVPRVLMRMAGAALLLFLTFTAARATYGMYGRFSGASSHNAASTAKQSELESELARLKDSVGELQSERGVEEALRERYGLARPGEGEIRIVRQAPLRGGEEPGFLERVWNRLFVW